MILGVQGVLTMKTKHDRYDRLAVRLSVPDRAKSSTASQLKDEYKTEKVKTAAKDSFSNVLSGIVDAVIDSVPLSGPVKELARKGKDKVIEWAGNAWDCFFR